MSMMDRYTIDQVAQYVGCTVEQLDDWMQTAPMGLTVNDPGEDMVQPMADAIHAWVTRHGLTCDVEDIVHPLIGLVIIDDLPPDDDCDVYDAWLWDIVAAYDLTPRTA